MILGVDHLALNVLDTDQAIKSLERQGFTTVFLERNKPNDLAKKSLLKHYQSTHDLGVFRPNKSGICVEITNHGFLADNDAPYHYHENYIELCTSNLNNEKTFWKSVFQFKELQENVLTFSCFVPNWSCTLKLTETTISAHHTLDGTGYSCLAFLTNDIDKDTQNALAAGASDVTVPFNSFVNGRHLEIVMFRTPGGAICELIKIESRNKDVKEATNY